MNNGSYPETGRLGLYTGVGLVAADMIGAGVFLSAGFMAQELDAGQLLLAWLAGAALALLGVATYSRVATEIHASGGEYRYLSDLLHPAVGYLAGWASLLVGFSAPLAIDALAAAAFVETLFPFLDRTVTALALVMSFCGLHAAGLRLSLRTQNLLAVLKVTLVTGFVLLGLALGKNHWPAWSPPRAAGGFPWLAFAGSLFYVSYAFSGWNAVVYSAGEFRRPADVKRAMWLGCLSVAVLYLLLNWVFVANLSPQRAQAVFNYEQARITLGHLLLQDLTGSLGGRIFSVVMVVIMLSAMSTLMFLGPRVCAAMARDGYLPRILCGPDGSPARGAIAFQGILALLLVAVYPLQKMLENLGALLTFFSALVALSVLKMIGTRKKRSELLPALTAALFLLAAGWMFVFGVQKAPGVLVWIGAVTVLGLVAYGCQRRFGRNRPLGRR